MQTDTPVLLSFDMDGIRVTLETGHVSHYRWDEHSQVYFENGWVHTWAPPLLLKNTPAEVEIYRAGEEQEITRPIPRTELDMGISQRSRILYREHPQR